MQPRVGGNSGTGLSFFKNPSPIPIRLCCHGYHKTETTESTSYTTTDKVRSSWSPFLLRRNVTIVDGLRDAVRPLAQYPDVLGGGQIECARENPGSTPEARAWGLPCKLELKSSLLFMRDSQRNTATEGGQMRLSYLTTVSFHQPLRT